MDKTVQKQMAERLMEASEDRINRNIKDSVFCNLFGKPEYLIQLYRVLHPEDKETQAEDLTIVTLSNIIVRAIYNDLGFLAGNRLLVLVEAQSSWSENIVVRFLMYLGETYRRYIEKNDLDLYTTKKVELPKPELYVVYIGDRKKRPETISLKRSFFGAENSCVEVEAKVIYDSTQGDILNQLLHSAKCLIGCGGSIRVTRASQFRKQSKFVRRRMCLQHIFLKRRRRRSCLRLQIRRENGKEPC